MELSVIIVNWNSVGYLRKCLASVYANTSGVDFEVIVIDNASFDGAAEMLAVQFPQVRFIQSGENLGFSGANNLAVTDARGEKLLFLNPDTEVTGTAIQTLCGSLDGLPTAGALGARLLNTDGTLQTSCVQSFPTILNQALDADLLRRLLPKLSLWGTRALFEKNGAPAPVDVVSGACLLVRREVFEAVGRFSTDYFMYSEDVDLCLKIAKAGWMNYYVESAIVVHHGGASTESQSRDHFSSIVMRESRLKLFLRHRGGLYAQAYRASVVVVSLLRCALLSAGMLCRPGARARLGTALSRWATVFRWGVRHDWIK